MRWKVTEQMTSSEFLSSRSTVKKRRVDIPKSFGEVKAIRTCLESLDLSFC